MDVGEPSLRLSLSPLSQKGGDSGPLDPQQDTQVLGQLASEKSCRRGNSFIRQMFTEHLLCAWHCGHAEDSGHTRDAILGYLVFTSVEEEGQIVNKSNKSDQIMILRPYLGGWKMGSTLANGLSVS